MKARNALGFFSAGFASLFDWISDIGNTASTPEETEARIAAMLGKHGITWHKNTNDALASDWKAVGDDMKSAMKSLGLK